jgi:hypothetical protein
LRECGLSTYRLPKCIDTVQVAAFVAVLDKDLADRKRTAEVDIGRLLTSSYAELASTELGKRLKRVPVALHAQKPQQLFDADMCMADFAGWHFV